jgi:hypothetical protein
MEIEMGKKYTSNGKPIRILCVDRPDPLFPVVGMDDNGAIFHFTKDGILSLARPTFNLVEAWSPTEGEWCWFFDLKGQEGAVLARFHKICSNRRYQTENGSNWKYCSKFVGELPEHLKGI